MPLPRAHRARLTDHHSSPPRSHRARPVRERADYARKTTPVRLHRIAAAAIAASAVITTAGAAPAHSAPPALRQVLLGSQPAYATAARDLGPVPGSQELTARLYLGSRAPQALASFLRAVTDPTSRSYRHFLTPGQYQQRFALSAEQRQTITEWLTSAGLRVTAETLQYIQATGSAEAVGKAFGTSIHRYDTEWGTLQAPAQNASVPATVAANVVAVDGLSAQAAASPASAQAAAPRSTDAAAVCSTYFGQKTAGTLPPVSGHVASFATCAYAPAQLRRAYGAATPGATGKGHTIAIVDAFGAATMPADADRFATATGDRPFRPGQYQQHVDPASWKTATGCATPDSWAGEQALDVETAHGYAPDAKVLYVGANSCLDSDLMDAEASIINTRAADIISNSWAEIIHAQPGHLTPGLVDAWNTLFQQAAAEGIGVYFAAGDCGDSSPAAAQTGINCDPTTTTAQADFPSGSPWVTSVGATSLATKSNGTYAWETSMGDELSILPNGTHTWTPTPGVFAYGGGGGPSDFPEPWYQKTVVPARLSTVDGAARRVTPDVSLEGDYALPVLIGLTVNGTFELVGYGGTSAACPGIAAIQADAEQASGHTIGFANPLLYAVDQVGLFHDVTNQPGKTAQQAPVVVRDYGAAAGNLRYVLFTLGQDYGLNAAPGYDDATGLGSPDNAYLRWFRTHA